MGMLHRVVADHPLEDAHQKDGNVFNSSKGSMLWNDTYATTYLLGEHVTGEETTAYVRGNQKKYVLIVAPYHIYRVCA